MNTDHHLSQDGHSLPENDPETPENASSANGCAFTTGSTTGSLNRAAFSLNPHGQLVWPLPNTLEGADFLRSLNLAGIIKDLENGRDVAICNLPDPQGEVRGFQVVIQTGQSAGGRPISEIHEVPGSLPQLGYMEGMALNPKGRYIWMANGCYLEEVRHWGFTPYIVSQGDVSVEQRYAVLDDIEEEYARTMPKDIWQEEHYFLFDTLSPFANDTNASLNHLFCLLRAQGYNVARITFTSRDELMDGLRYPPSTLHQTGWR